MTTITQFPQNEKPQMSSNRDNHNWPEDWEDKKHWHGQDFDPYIQFRNFIDGSRMVYCDPSVGTFVSHEHWNGNHTASLQDGHVSHVVMQRSEFTGDSHSHARGGHSDETTAGHTRVNTKDHYENVAGVHHAHHSQGAVSFVPGNQVHAYGGSVMHSALNDDAVHGFGHGGQGDKHPNRMLFSKKEQYYAAEKANQTMATAQGNQVFQADKGNMKLNAQSGMITATGSQTFINGTSQVSIQSSQLVLNQGGGMDCPPFRCPGATFTGGNKQGDTSVAQYGQGGGGGGGGGVA